MVKGTTIWLDVNNDGRAMLQINNGGNSDLLSGVFTTGQKDMNLRIGQDVYMHFPENMIGNRHRASMFDAQLLASIVDALANITGSPDVDEGKREEVYKKYPELRPKA